MYFCNSILCVPKTFAIYKGKVVSEEYFIDYSGGGRVNKTGEKEYNNGS